MATVITGNTGTPTSGYTSSSLLTSFRFYLPIPLVLQTLSMASASTSTSGTHFRLALYADSSGAPGALVAKTSNQVTVSGAHVYNIAPTNTPTLTVGWYWLALQKDATWDIGSEGYSESHYYSSPSYSTTDGAGQPPDPFGSYSTTASAVKYNFWLTGTSLDTYPAAGNVWHGTGTYGPTGADYTPSKVATSIQITGGNGTNLLTAAEIKSGVSVDPGGAYTISGAAPSGGGNCVIGSSIITPCERTAA